MDQRLAHWTLDLCRVPSVTGDEAAVCEETARLIPAGVAVKRVGNCLVCTPPAKPGLPTVGLFASQRIATDLTLSARADYLSLKIDDYKGRLLNTEAAMTWRFAKNVGIGAMWRYVNYRVDVDKDNWAGRIKYRFSGPAVFMQVGF